MGEAVADRAPPEPGVARQTQLPRHPIRGSVRRV